MDNRKKETDRKIKNAFILLMGQKQPKSITAMELCKTAGINRSTFYDHYPYMDVLIREIIREQVEIICEVPVKGEAGWTSLPREDIRAYIRNFRNNAILKQFMGAEDATLYNQLLIEEQISLTLKGTDAGNNMYYRACFQNMAATGVIMKWMMDGMNLPEEELVGIIEDFSRAMFSRPGVVDGCDRLYRKY